MTNTIQIAQTNDNIHDKKVLLFLLCIFIISPFVAFILALTQAKKSSSYVIYFLWGVIFAWHMNPTSSQRYDDLEGIIERFNETVITFPQLSNQLIEVITFSPEAPKEWYELFMTWLTKCFSNNPHLYFVFCSIPWLFFELSSLHRITSDRKFHQSIICLVILLLFVAPRDLITLQNPRFTTGVWLSIYATLGYFHDKSKRPIYIILILFSPLVHSAFWFYVIAFFSGNLMIKYPKVSLSLLYASIPFSFLSYDLLYSISFTSLPLPTVMATWIERYLSEDYYATYVANENASGLYWISDIFNFLMKCAYLTIPIYLNKDRNYYSANKSLTQLVSYFLFFYALVSFIQFVPVLGERFFWIVRILGIYIFFKAIYPRNQWIIWFILFSCSWSLFKRYFYHGAVESCVPLEIFWEPLPLAITDMI